MSLEARDRRCDLRVPCSRQIWWRGASDSLYQQGWLVDESSKGLAFLARTEDLPRAGEVIRAMSAEGDSGQPAPRGVVRRVQPIQSGVVLIAVELFPAEQAVVTRAAAAAVRAA